MQANESDTARVLERIETLAEFSEFDGGLTRVAFSAEQRAAVDAVAGWMAKPLNAGLLLLLIGATFYHLKLGVQVVIEDYVSTEWQKLTAIIVVTFGCIALALASAIAVILVMVSN